MAEVIEFVKKDDLYECDCLPAGATIWDRCKLDHSGRYVREADYNALLERQRRLVAAAVKAYSDWDGNTHEDECKSMRRLEVALAEEVV